MCKIYKSDRIRILTFVRMMVVLLTILLLGSCKKFLDVKKTRIDRFIETSTDCQAILDTYSIMNVNYPSDGQASSDDYYLGTNVYPGSYAQESKEVYTWAPAAMHLMANPQWLKPYEIVYRANLVIESLQLDKVKATADAGTLSKIRGAALFFRAYALWNVAQLYAKPYSASSQDPGIPARTSSDLNDSFGRGIVKDTYDRIVQDLQEAVSLLDATSIVATRPNKASANAMLARVYLSMENYGEALNAANAAMGLITLNKKDLLDYNLLDPNIETPFANLNDEVIFQSNMTNISTKGYADEGDLLLFPGQAENPRARINPELYNSYASNDLRKVIFFKENADIYTGTYRFTGSYWPAGADLFNGLAVDELYLVRAECYARAGNFTLAMKDLSDLLRKRWKTGAYTSQSADNELDALNIILSERRKELVMRGQRWTDLRRLNKDARFKIDLFRKEDGTGAILATLPANDARYTLLIPKQVIDNSNGIVQQNVR